MPVNQIALEWLKPDGSVFAPEDIQSPEQTLDLWRGVIASRFKLAGTNVTVTTVCSPDSDTLGFRINSPLVRALGIAQHWRERLELPRDRKWDDIIARLSPIPVTDGKYVALESSPDTWENVNSRRDHPFMLMPLGMLPGGPDVDRATMASTLDAVLKTWDWEGKIWGWDYPMIAMTAARLGRPDVAMEILLRDGPNNRYTPAGHCPQGAGGRAREIASYLPANGAFLSAVALMVAGWDGNTGLYPGIPRDGTWTIRAEGLRPLP